MASPALAVRSLLRADVQAPGHREADRPPVLMHLGGGAHVVARRRSVAGSSKSKRQPIAARLPRAGVAARWRVRPDEIAGG